MGDRHNIINLRNQKEKNRKGREERKGGRRSLVSPSSLCVLCALCGSNSSFSYSCGVSQSVKFMMLCLTPFNETRMTLMAQLRCDSYLSPSC
jgi:hypothetical protein